MRSDSAGIQTTIRLLLLQAEDKRLWMSAKYFRPRSTESAAEDKV